MLRNYEVYNYVKAENPRLKDEAVRQFAKQTIRDFASDNIKFSKHLKEHIFTWAASSTPAH